MEGKVTTEEGIFQGICADGRGPDGPAGKRASAKKGATNDWWTHAEQIARCSDQEEEEEEKKFEQCEPASGRAGERKKKILKHAH